MACNSIHFIDLVEFLTNQSIVTVDTSNVDKNGYIVKDQAIMKLLKL